jgi:hypothetical protein
VKEFKDNRYTRNHEFKAKAVEVPEPAEQWEHEKEQDRKHDQQHPKDNVSCAHWLWLRMLWISRVCICFKDTANCRRNVKVLRGAAMLNPRRHVL